MKQLINKVAAGSLWMANIQSPIYNSQSEIPNSQSAILKSEIKK